MYLYAAGMAEGLQSRPRAVSGTSRRAGEDRELGASALEWAIIAAISVVMATVIGSVIYNVVSNKSTQVQNCATQTVDTKCDTGGGTGTK